MNDRWPWLIGRLQAAGFGVPRDGFDCPVGPDESGRRPGLVCDGETGHVKRMAKDMDTSVRTGGKHRGND